MRLKYVTIAVESQFKQLRSSRRKKVFRAFNGIRTPGLCVCATVLSQLSYEDPYTDSRPIARGISVRSYAEVVTKIFRIDGLPNFLPLVLRRRSANVHVKRSIWVRRSGGAGGGGGLSQKLSIVMRGITSMKSNLRGDRLNFTVFSPKSSDPFPSLPPPPQGDK